MANLTETKREKEKNSSKLLLNVEDYHEKAKQILDKMTYDFYSTGADDKLTLYDNQFAFSQIKIRPRILVDVSSHNSIDSTNYKTQLLSRAAAISFPCIIAPTSFQRLANSQHGELATVRAAVACSTIMCVSTGASTSMELIAEEHQRYIREKYPQSLSQLWYQLYVTKNRQFSQKLIKRAEKCGYKALVITVDTAELGNRECDFRNNFTLPNGIRAENLFDENNNLAHTYRQLSTDPTLSWKDLEWIRSITSLPLIIKGVMHPDDARKAVEYRLQGIIVSNHGGRQLDTTQSTIDVLPDIMAAIGNDHQEIDVYIDGGIRRGTDILKSIALGAKAVLVGRPILWGLAVDGEQGVINILEILRKEFRLAMMLCGCSTMNDIKRNNLLVINNYKISKL